MLRSCFYFTLHGNSNLVEEAGQQLGLSFTFKEPVLAGEAGPSVLPGLLSLLSPLD